MILSIKARLSYQGRRFSFHVDEWFSLTVCSTEVVNASIRDNPQPLPFKSWRKKWGKVH